MLPYVHIIACNACFCILSLCIPGHEEACSFSELFFSSSNHRFLFAALIEIASTMAQFNVVLTDAITVGGGGFDQASKIESQLILPKFSVNGRIYVEINTADPRMKRFVQNDFTMTEHMLKKRSLATEVLMQKMVANGNVELEAMPLKRPRRELFDELCAQDGGPDVEMEVKIQAEESDEVTVRMMAAWTMKTRLKIECNEKNIALLLRKPVIEAATFNPVIPEDSKCIWSSSRHAVVAEYYNKKHEKYFLKTITIAKNLEPTRFQRKVDKAVKTLGEFLIYFDDKASSHSDGSPANEEV